MTTTLFSPSSPSQNRLQSISPVSGSPSSVVSPTPTIVTTPVVTYNGLPTTDQRVRISLPPGSPSIFYKDSTNALLAILQNTNGVLFPVQPSSTINFSANYQQMAVTHSNFAYYGYQNSELKPIDVSCIFPVRSPYDGWYVLAAMTFLRALTFMFTGNDGNYAGAPPIVARLSGMGFGGFDNIPIIITNVQTSYPDNVDYVTVSVPTVLGGGLEYAKVPTEVTITVSCQPVFSRAFASQFSTLGFASAADRLLGPQTPSFNTTVNVTTTAPPAIETIPSAPLTTLISG